MKYIKSLFSMLMILSLCVFTSCEQDNEGFIHNADNQGLSFTFNSFELSAPANNPVISVPVYRAVANDAYTANITVTTEAPGVTVPSSISFAAGENQTTIDINLGETLGVGEIATITIKLSEADASAGAVSTATVSAFKEYVFESLGIISLCAVIRYSRLSLLWLGVLLHLILWLLLTLFRAILKLLGINLHSALPSAEARFQHLLVRLKTFTNNLISIGHEFCVYIRVDAFGYRVPKKLLSIEACSIMLCNHDITLRLPQLATLVVDSIISHQYRIHGSK